VAQGTMEGLFLTCILLVLLFLWKSSSSSSSGLQTSNAYLDYWVLFTYLRKM